VDDDRARLDGGLFAGAPAQVALRLRPEGKKRKTVQVKDIEETVARIARIPPKSVSANDRDRLATLESDLKLVIFGQDQAIELLAASSSIA
jgi:ATP-dependent Clp protease ATP-binding subunit ClpA